MNVVNCTLEGCSRTVVAPSRTGRGPGRPRNPFCSKEHRVEHRRAQNRLAARRFRGRHDITRPPELASVTFGTGGDGIRPSENVQAHQDLLQSDIHLVEEGGRTLVKMFSVRQGVPSRHMRTAPGAQLSDVAASEAETERESLSAAEQAAEHRVGVMSAEDFGKATGGKFLERDDAPEGTDRPRSQWHDNGAVGDLAVPGVLRPRHWSDQQPQFDRAERAERRAIFVEEAAWLVRSLAAGMSYPRHLSRDAMEILIDDHPAVAALIALHMPDNKERQYITARLDANRLGRAIGRTI